MCWEVSGSAGVVGGVRNKPSKGPTGIFQYVYVSSEKEHYTAQRKAQSPAPLPGPSPWRWRTRNSREGGGGVEEGAGLI